MTRLRWSEARPGRLVRVSLSEKDAAHHAPGFNGFSGVIVGRTMKPVKFGALCECVIDLEGHNDFIKVNHCFLTAPDAITLLGRLAGI